MENNSFYDLDYIIHVNEVRLEQYTSAYQKVLERLTHIILVYSALTIFLVPLIQDGAFFKIKSLCFLIALVVFLLLFMISIVFTIRLIVPVNIAYLSSPSKYYDEYRLEYEKKVKDPLKVKQLLKTSYINELQDALEINLTAFRAKSSYYYNALLYSLLAVVPYMVCLGFHVSLKEDNIHKVQIVNSINNSNFIQQDSSSMSKSKDFPKNIVTSTSFTTNLPGINSSEVIPSQPYLIKENSKEISNKENAQHIPKKDK